MLLAPHVAQAQMDAAIWKKAIPIDGWMRRLPSGTLLMGNAKSLTAFDPATGAELWTRTDLGGVGKQTIESIQSDIALLNLPSKDAPTIRAIDLKDGRDRWKMSGLSLGHWAVPSKQAVLLWFWGPTDRVNDKEFGGKMMMIRLADGQVLWEDPAFFATWPADREGALSLWHLQGPAFDTDSTMITYMSGMGIRRWDITSGKKLWSAELKAGNAHTPFYGYSPLVVDKASQKVYVPIGLGLAAVSLADGSVGMRARLRGFPRQMLALPAGLLVRTGPETVPRPGRTAPRSGDDGVILLDPATGEKRWKEEFRTGMASTNFVVRNDKAYIWTDNRLMALNLATGQSEVLAKLPGFKNDDVPSELVASDAGLLLRGETNVQFVGYDGTLVHHTTFKRPGRSLLVRAVATGLQNAEARAAASPTDLMGPLVRSGAVDIGDPDELRKRTTQTVHSGLRTTMYAEVKRAGKEDNGFVLIDGTNGKILGDVITAGLLNAAAFSEKNVDLAFDLENGWLHYFLRQSGNSGKFTGEFGAWRLGGSK